VREYAIELLKQTPLKIQTPQTPQPKKSKKKNKKKKKKKKETKKEKKRKRRRRLFSDEFIISLGSCNSTQAT
jgi:outer membrane biosynthesis protein TonB